MTAVHAPGVEALTRAEFDHAPGFEPLQARSAIGDRLPGLPALSPLPTYLGVAITAIGFAAVIFAWSKVAGVSDNVALQLPYLVSGGLVGLGLVMVGVTVINVAAKRRDTQLRQQQTELLADALRELRNAIEQ